MSWWKWLPGVPVRCKCPLDRSGRLASRHSRSRRRSASWCPRCHRRALAVAADIDAQITARLKALQTFPVTASKELLDAGQLAGVFDRAMIRAERTNPAEVNAWWKALRTSQQHGLLREFPAQIGWLDGLPATVRDEANRITLAAGKQQLQGQLEGLDAREPAATVRRGPVRHRADAQPGLAAVARPGGRRPGQARRDLGGRKRPCARRAGRCSTRLPAGARHHRQRARDRVVR